MGSGGSKKTLEPGAGVSWIISIYSLHFFIISIILSFSLFIYIYLSRGPLSLSLSLSLSSHDDDRRTIWGREGVAPQPTSFSATLDFAKERETQFPFEFDHVSSTRIKVDSKHASVDSVTVWFRLIACDPNCSQEYTNSFKQKRGWQRIENH